MSTVKTLLRMEKMQCMLARERRPRLATVPQSTPPTPLILQMPEVGMRITALERTGIASDTLWSTPHRVRRAHQNFEVLAPGHGVRFLEKVVTHPTRGEKQRVLLMKFASNRQGDMLVVQLNSSTDSHPELPAVGQHDLVLADTTFETYG